MKLKKIFFSFKNFLKFNFNFLCKTKFNLTGKLICDPEVPNFSNKVTKLKTWVNYNRKK